MLVTYIPYHELRGLGDAITGIRFCIVTSWEVGTGYPVFRGLDRTNHCCRSTTIVVHPADQISRRLHYRGSLSMSMRENTQ